MNRQWKKTISAMLMFLMLITTMLPAQAVIAASTAVTSFSYPTTSSTNAVYGAPYRVNLQVSNVTDSVYQQVYSHEAIVDYDPNVLEIKEILKINNSYFPDPVVTELAPGKVKLVHQVTSVSKPYPLTTAAKSLSNVTFTPKVNAVASTSISMTGITITNGQGDKLPLDNVTTTILISPSGDKTALQALVDKANATYTNAVEGTQEGQYAVGTKAALKTSITQAQTALNGVGGLSASPTAQFQSELDAKYTNLFTALNHFKAGLIGQYTMNMTALKETADTASSMGSYFLKPYTLTLKDGRKKVSFTLKDSTVVPSFKVEQNGVLTETATLSTDTTANTRVVEFEVTDLSAILNAQVHVSTKLPNGDPYEMDHKIRLKFDSLVDAVNITGLNTAIKDAQAKYDNGVEGNADGQYPAAAKTAYLAAINQAKSVANNAASTQQQVNDAVIALQAAGNTFGAAVIVSLADGQYTIDFNILKDGTEEASVMETYSLKPAKLNVVGGKKLVSLTLTNSDWIQFFQTQKDGAYVDAEVVSPDTLVNGVNQRKVQFEVNDLAAKLNAYTHVKIPDGVLPFPYDNKYYVQLKFDARSIVPVTSPGTGEVSKSQLNILILQAQAQHDAAVEGSALGQYPAGAKAALQTAIAAAQAIASNATASQNNVDNAVTALQAAVSAFAASVNAAAGVDYELNFTAMHGTQDKASSMDGYFLKPGKLTVQQGSSKVTVTLKDSTTIPSFKVEQNGTLVETATLSTDTVNNTRVVQFPVNDLTVLLNAQVHVSTTMPNGTPYEMDHAIRLKFDVGNKNALNSLVTQAEAEFDAAVVGSAVGQYPAAAKAALQTAILSAKAVMNNLGAGQAAVDSAVTALQTAVTTFRAAVNPSTSGPIDPSDLTDGEYTIGFSVLRDGTAEASVMNGYTVKPAKLNVVDGKKSITLTLTNSDWIQFFQTQQNGAYVDSEIVSPNTVVDGVNQRVVKFEVDDLSAKLNAYTHVKIPDGVLTFPYDYKYYVQFKFDTNNILKPDSSNPTNPNPAYPTADGNYTLDYHATSVDPSGEPISNYLLTAGKVNIQSGKYTLTFKVKTGSYLTKLTWAKPDGSTMDYFPKTVAKAAGLVRVLSDEDTKDVQFVVDSLAGTYIANFTKSDGENAIERAYQIQFNNFVPDSSGGSEGGTGGNTGGGGGSTPSSSYADGKYSINYKILKFDTSETSVMQEYVVTPGLLTVEGGKQYVSFTLKQSKEVTDFQVEQNGSMVDTSVLSTDEAKNTRVVQFEVPDLSARLKGWVKISWKEVNYFHDYDVHVTFDKSSITKLSDTAAAALSGGSSAEATLKNGDYNLGFQILQSRNNLESIVNDYVQHPSTLTIKDQQKFVSMTLLNNKEITDFKVMNNNELTAAEVVSTQAEENKRVVKFEVKNLSAALPAQLKWVAEDGKEEVIDFDIVFDVDSLGKDPAEETPTEVVSEPEVPAAPEVNPEAALADIQDHWAKALIERAIGLGIVNGYEDGTFRPNGEVSRAEFTAMIGRALKLEGQDSDLAFIDKDRIPTWVKPTVAQAVEKGIISSYEDSTFRADRNITRAEIAVMIGRALNLPLDEHAELTFSDANQIPAWAKPQVAAAYQLGMIKGRENNQFAPNASATRAEAVALILAMMSNLK